MKSRGVVLCALLLLASAAATSVVAQVEFEMPPEDTRPEEGQGSIWADGNDTLTFTWSPFSDNPALRDFLWARVPGSPDDYARLQPNGKIFVHAGGQDALVQARVNGLWYVGEAVFQTSYFANCSVFNPSTGSFRCFIGPGPASMNTHGEVTRLLDGAECRISARLAAFYIPNDNGQLEQGLYVSSVDQYAVNITNCQLD
jgi:hypothetical protein